MKNALITGGSRGIGEAMTMKLGEMGYNVLINYVSDSSKTLTDEIIKKLTNKYKVKGYAFKADVSKYEECQKLVNEAVRLFDGKIDVLVNNAGISSSNVPFTEMKYEEYMKVIDTNFLGTFHMCHLVIPHMLKQKKGCIVNSSSVGGIMGVAGQTDYCASKAAILGMSRALAMEFGSKNIRINSICAGAIWTDLLKNIKKDKMALIEKNIPLGRIGKVEDAANAMEFLIKNEYMTGQYISPNGGLFMP